MTKQTMFQKPPTKESRLEVPIQHHVTVTVNTTSETNSRHFIFSFQCRSHKIQHSRCSSH